MNAIAKKSQSDIYIIIIYIYSFIWYNQRKFRKQKIYAFLSYDFFLIYITFNFELFIVLINLLLPMKNINSFFYF